MPRVRALYSIVQYVPNAARAEVANVGVAVFIPESGRTVVRISPTLARVKKFFTPDRTDLRRIELAIESLRHRLETAQGEFKSEADFEHFVAARADAVRLTSPRLVVLSGLEAKIDELYAELVGDLEAAPASQASNRPWAFATVTNPVIRDDAWPIRSVVTPGMRFDYSGRRGYDLTPTSESKESEAAIVG